MQKNYQLPPSIFNDVIGPVMRGPSASHCAAAARIGRLARDLMGGDILSVLVEFDSGGSLATTHADQGSDIGLFGGLLGWREDDPRLASSPKALKDAGISSQIKITSFDAPHPNTYRLTLTGRTQRHRLTAVSTGGGMISITGLNGTALSIDGGSYETLLCAMAPYDAVRAFLNAELPAGDVSPAREDSTGFLRVTTQEPLPAALKNRLRTRYGIDIIRTMAPVLPVLSRRDISVPFLTCSGMMEYRGERNMELWELALVYESARAGISEEEVFSRMHAISGILQRSIDTGIEGTSFRDRILGCQSGGFRDKMDSGALLDGGMLNRMILYTTALMEMKSSMNLVVAAPTAGSCGGLPGAVIGAAGSLGFGRDEITRAMLAAGMIGIFIAAHSTFAAEVCGCQAECGAGSGMAAAALVTLAGGSCRQAAAASSLALQNILGMICDPVANRVEVPCLGKNVMAAANALACANMALADFDPVIPLDEVIETMDAVGKSLPRELRCTALGGLSVTPASKRIEKELRENNR